MEIKYLKEKLDKVIFDSLVSRGFNKLRPPQELAIKAGLLEGKNMVVASPTASGKTIVAEIACLNNILKKRGKAIYIVPMRALATEKFNDFKKDYGDHIKVGLSIGDLDSDDYWLDKFDLIVCTSEKLDSLIRHGAHWLSSIGTIVIDEIHMLDDVSRGPTLEVLITRMRTFLKKAQIIALSATIKNCDEIAEWLNAELVRSDYRPIELKEGVYFNNKLYFDKEEILLESESEEPELSLVEDAFKKNKSTLIFLSSRRNAESSAKRCSKFLLNKLNNEDKIKLNQLSEEVKNVLETPTKQCENLAECIQGGVAFHHAGLVQKQRGLIEDAFRNRILKVICATPTLCMGINLPSFRSVVRDLKRYSDEEGMGWIPVLEFKQMIGRAGRPGFEDHGEGIAIAKSEEELNLIREKYIEGEPEEIYSKLSVEPILRMHVLGLIASGEVSSFDKLIAFFEKTFYVHQFRNIEKVEYLLRKVLTTLEEYEFIKIDKEKLIVTPLGKRVSELYIDPSSAKKIIEALKQSKHNYLYFLHQLSLCTEMKPLLNISQRDFFSYQEKYTEYADELPDFPSPWDYEYEDFVRAFKTALMFFDWINELREDILVDKYNETPGMLRSRLQNLDWLIYSAIELAELLVFKEDLSLLKKLRVRVEYGIREELLYLVSIEGIGRVRARLLFKNGIKTSKDILKAPIEKLSTLLGSKLALKIVNKLKEEK